MATSSSLPFARTAATPPPFTVAPIHADAARLERITVCTRPFRAQGPRLEAERLGDKLVIHNYGHGGSGWSLGWGSAELVLPLALADGVREVGVIGCGAIGLSTALALQRAGARVTIYARDVPPEVRSSRATGLWSPDSRIALRRGLDSSFPARWEGMARTGWAAFQGLLHQPGNPVDMHNRYELSDLPPDEAIAERWARDPIGFAHMEQRLDDLYPRHTDLGPGEHPFAATWCRHEHTLRFNITALSNLLVARFREAGGTLVRTEFHTPADLQRLPERVIVHCTGYGARALFGDTSLTPVRGQIGWLPAQPEADYSLQWRRLSVVSRGDGIVVQIGSSSDETGWDNASEEPDRAEAEQAVGWLAGLQRGEKRSE